MVLVGEVVASKSNGCFKVSWIEETSAHIASVSRAHVLGNTRAQASSVEQDELY